MIREVKPDKGGVSLKMVVHLCEKLGKGATLIKLCKTEEIHLLSSIELSIIKMI